MGTKPTTSHVQSLCVFILISWCLLHSWVVVQGAQQSNSSAPAPVFIIHCNVLTYHVSSLAQRCYKVSCCVFAYSDLDQIQIKSLRTE